jgi:UDP-N-acetylmuramoylalanine--D-glutamate ligase
MRLLYILSISKWDAFLYSIVVIRRIIMQSVVAPVGILGFGVEGQSSLQYLLSIGIKEIVIMDKNPIDPQLLPKETEIKTYTGEQYLDGLKECVTVIRSAGVYPMLPELLKFQMNGGLLTSQIEIYFQETKAKKIIGVTGTLGKGSVVSMIAHILKSVDKPCEIGGNFGIPALDLLKTDSPDRVVILELSSFQLMTLSISPSIAVVLRVTSEHLDWHRSVEEYRDAKANLVRYQKKENCCIYLQDSVHSTAIAKQTKALTLSFGHGACDACVEGETLSVSGHKLNLSECKIRGVYQLENMAAAALACKALGVSGGESLQTLKSYEPLRFRRF